VFLDGCPPYRDFLQQRDDDIPFLTLSLFLEFGGLSGIYGSVTFFFSWARIGLTVVFFSLVGLAPVCVFGFPHYTQVGV